MALTISDMRFNYFVLKAQQLLSAKWNGLYQIITTLRSCPQEEKIMQLTLISRCTTTYRTFSFKSAAAHFHAMKYWCKWKDIV